MLKTGELHENIMLIKVIFVLMLLLKQIYMTFLLIHMFVHRKLFSFLFEFRCDENASFV